MHCGNEPMKIIKKLKLIEGADWDDSDLFCESCTKGKQPRNPFQKIQESKKLLERIHVDLIGPITPSSLGDNRYVLTIVDAFSGFVRVFPLKHKSDASEEIINFINWA